MSRKVPYSEGIGYICPHHDIAVPRGTQCFQCMAEWPNLPDPATMTPHQRVNELKKWRGVLTVTWPMLAARIDALTNTEHYTHEYIDRALLERQAANW